MSILVDFGITTDHFKLGSFVAAQKDLDGELERIVPTEDQVIPYVWVSGPREALNELTESLEASEKTTSVTVLDELPVDNSDRFQYLYRIEWILEDLDIIKGIIVAGGSILEGKSTNYHWELKFRFQDHHDVAEFYQYLADNNITDFTIHTIQELDGRMGEESSPLTSSQREALFLAAKRGYFDIPREYTLKDVGEELGITQQAASERIRRGVRNVIFRSLHLPTEFEE